MRKSSHWNLVVGVFTLLDFQSSLPAVTSTISHCCDEIERPIGQEDGGLGNNLLSAHGQDIYNTYNVTVRMYISLKTTQRQSCNAVF